MRGIKIILFLVALLMLNACSRGPDSNTLNLEIQQRLNQQFEDNLFKIKKLTRKGSAPRLDGADGIYVYFNLELEFLREYNLASWRGLNIGTLAAVLGSTTTGIEGFNSSGNKRGERLIVRGRLGFYQQDGGWVANKFTPIQLEKNLPVDETLNTHSPDSIIENIRDLLEHNTDSIRSEHDLVTLTELRRSLARIDLAQAELEQYHTLGTGWPTGSYYKFGEAYSEYAKKQGFKIFNYASEGSLENAYRVNTGRIDFALLQSDVAEVVYKGWIEEGQLPSPDLRAIASLWPEAVHVITLDSTGIKNLSDISGKKVAIGSLRSGSRFTAARIWQAAGFTKLHSDNIKFYSRGNSIKALEAGEVDAIVLVGAIPDPAIQELTQRRDDVHLVSLKRTLISELVENNVAYYEKVIPEKTYPGQTQAVLTLGMTALMTTNVRTEDKVVEQYMQLMSEGSEEISKTFYRAAFITYKTSRLGISMPLHPAAERFYEKVKKQIRLNKINESKNNDEVLEKE